LPYGSKASRLECGAGVPRPGACLRRALGDSVLGTPRGSRRSNAAGCARRLRDLRTGDGDMTGRKFRHTTTRGTRTGKPLRTSGFVPQLGSKLVSTERSRRARPGCQSPSFSPIQRGSAVTSRRASSRDDNRLENLRMLCPNCHSQTPTYSGRNSKRRHLQEPPLVV